jgi:hypothetical protein
MRRKKLMTAGGAAAVAGALLVATPAQAAGSYTTNCDAPVTVTGNVGDDVTITFGPGCTPGQWWYLWNVNGTYYNPATTYDQSGFLDYVSSTDPSEYLPSDDYADDWYVYNPTPSGGQSVTATIRATDGAGNPLRYGATMANITESYSPYLSLAVVYGGTGEDAGTPIADVIQQVPSPATGSCDTLDDTALNWAGVKSGGWSKSWAQWANDGKGGSVCTRTLRYDNGWAVVS